MRAPGRQNDNRNTTQNVRGKGDVRFRLFYQLSVSTPFRFFRGAPKIVSLTTLGHANPTLGTEK
jgi:hypothetical protein